MANSIPFKDYSLKDVALFLPLLLLLGCKTQVNLIRAVAPVQPISAAGQLLSVTVSGSGTCRALEIDWGDSWKETKSSVDLSSNPVFTHNFGLGGGKTVTVEGKSGCEGKVNTRFVVEPSIFHLAFAQRKISPGLPAPTCVATPNHPGVRAGELVRITTVSVTGAPGGINFGCPLGGCIYDADGKPGSVADSRFPFPGLKEYSLVLRVSPQVVQGGTNMSFTATSSNALEICLNDFDMRNNSGGYEIDIRIDQLGP